MMYGLDAAIDEMATRFAVTPSEVRRILREHIGTLERRARIKQFIAPLAIKQVKEVLRKQAACESSVTQVVLSDSHPTDSYRA